ncbi:secreted RxLR effector protein 161-like [Vigna angularis]|uniref:secreted RxLR effector protein 161-like n=1 Tax=Phaseolus angularis TaxID=3914 RepID=UPI0022B40C96|nr:secreted RxLR effector protein 161-like [Vigna angularis]
MEFTHTATGLLMHQQKYVGELLERFKMTLCNDVRSPLEVNVKLREYEAEEKVNEIAYKQIVGSLRFLSNSRPYLMFSIGLISRFMSNPKKIHMLVVKRILRYIKGTANHGSMFPYGMQKNELKLMSYADSDYDGDQVERKSTSGHIFFQNEAPISWCSKKQFVVALSSSEAEYIVGCFAACQGIWLNELLKELKILRESPV